WGRGKVGRMEIPNQAGVANPVRAFFTAEMNGCTFLVGGDPMSPVVSHFNVNNPEVGPGLTQQQKDDVMASMATAVLRAKRGGPNIGGQTGTVLRWVDPAVAGGHTMGEQLSKSGVRYQRTAAEDAAAETQIRTQLAAQRHKLTPFVAGGGDQPIFDTRIATMGVMDAANHRWQFFYQRTLYVSYYHIRRLGRWGGLIKVLGRDHRQREAVQTYLHIPGSEYNDLWPVGHGIMNIPAHGDPDL
ncbi:MAG TPA: hypothetical protein VE173_07610, partial [Longimicrobiales bacterium]|nr:hypothetical protein [Longimicrobiales bacterium]